MWPNPQLPADLVAFTEDILRRDQFNLLVYGPDPLYFKQKQKNITKFWLTGIF